MERSEFLQRVRTAAQAGRAYRVHTRHDLPANIGYIGGGSNLVARLADEVNLSGGQSCVVKNDEEARQALVRLIEQYNARSVLRWEHPLLDRLQIGRLLQELQITSLSNATLKAFEPAVQRSQQLVADLGITSVWQAVAETGTLAMASAPGRERTASLLPPVHVAIVERAQILPDLFDLFATIQTEFGDNLPSNLVLITGPSKTGDLELRLITGVHGPGNWHVIVIDN